MQCTSTVLMIRPVAFGFNDQTAVNNHFQVLLSTQTQLQEQALKEFDGLVELLKANDIDVIVIEDSTDVIKPDAIFPNNWFSCTKDMICIFPMFAPNRRTEKRKDIIDRLKNDLGIKVIHDMSKHEIHSMFLEGTGSMVCDHQHKIIYACLSERTHKKLVDEYAALINYTTCIFSAVDSHKNAIYHTNVLMCIGDNFAVLCAEAISNENERYEMTSSLERTGHQLILISQDQVNNFAGNMLQLNSRSGVPLLLMSKTAETSLQPDQLMELKKYIRPLVADVRTIEKTGGGSVRCMVAEIFT
ncbi:MAG: arginine deiminase-related protein [Ferruginibacter sp.]